MSGITNKQVNMKKMDLQEALERYAKLQGYNSSDFYTESGEIDIEKVLQKQNTSIIKSVTFLKGGEILKFELRNDFTGYVYLIRSGNSVKIGKTKYIKRRFSQIQVSNPDEVELLYSRKVHDCNVIESNLHECFYDKKIRGEWFDLSKEDIKTAIRMIKDF